MRTGGTHSEFWCYPSGQGREGVAPKGPKYILYKHRHVACQIKCNEKFNTVVQNFCPGSMSMGHQRSNRRIVGPLCLIITQLLLGFLARTLKLSQVALWMRTGGTHLELWCARRYAMALARGLAVKATCKSALNPPVVCSTDRSKAVVPVLVLLLVALWFILRGDLLCVFPCVILFLCFSVLLVLRLPRLVRRELILVLFVRLFGLCLFRFVGFLFLLGSGGGGGLRFVIVALPGLFSYFFCDGAPSTCSNFSIVIIPE